MLVLTREELWEITGSRQRARQREHLDAMGIPYVVRADGWPVVDRQAYHQAMGYKAVKDEPREEAVLHLDRIK